MAAQGNVTLPPLDVIGGVGVTNFARSGGTIDFPLLTARGEMYGHGSGALTVPMQKLFITGSMGGNGRGAVTVPLQQITARGGHSGALTVPMQVMAATGTVPVIGRAALTVPFQTVYGHVMVVGRGHAALTVPMQVVGTRMAARASLAVPMQVVAAHALTSVFGSAALVVPLQRLSATSVVFSLPGRGAVTVPMQIAGPYAIARLGVPMQQVYGHGQLGAVFEAWVMNVRNSGVTRWTNFPFVQFTRQAQRTFAVGNDGNLYLLGGDLDVAAPISWEFETGLADLGSVALKHLPYLYMSGIIDGEIQITLKDDRGRAFAYEYDTKDRGAVHMTHRRKLGNGIRSTNVAFNLKSTSGAYIELDWLAPEATNTQRNI